MGAEQDLPRLNLLLELVSECAGLDSIGALREVLADRLRWVFGYGRCTVCLQTPGGLEWWTMGGGGEALQLVAAPSLQPEERGAIDSALASGAPACHGLSMRLIAYPLAVGGHTFGALCLTTDREPYTSRDLRFLHHLCLSVSAVLARISQASSLQEKEQLAHSQVQIANRERAARERAETASRERDEFLAVLGHELRNPLAPILTAVTLLKRRGATAMSPELEIVDRQSRHLHRLIDDLLDVSRLAAGKITLRREWVDLVPLVANAVEMARPLLDAKHQRLVVELPVSGMIVDGDPARLLQIFSNLLSNASRYTPEGGRVEVRAEKRSEEAVVAVRDDGIGIDRALLTRIFDMFVQGPRSHDRQSGGLGLGLAVARALATLHGGTLSAESEGAGCGSTFTVTLPARSAERVPLKTADDLHVMAADRRVTRRVLLVDDNVDAADSLARLLRSAGHDVAVAYDAAEALALSSRFQPEVAILDIGLPALDGYQLASEMRTRAGKDAMPRFIALTGYGQEADRALSREAGFSHHLVKPADLSELLAAIASRRDEEVAPEVGISVRF